MNSNYVAEIQSKGVPDEQLVSGDMYPSTYMYPDSGYKLLVWDACIRATCPGVNAVKVR